MQRHTDEEDVVLAKKINVVLQYVISVLIFSLGLLQDVRLVVFNCMVSCSSDVKFCKTYFPTNICVLKTTR